MEWADLKTMFYEITGDSEAHPFWFTDDMLRGFANQALRDLVRGSQCLDWRQVIAIQSGTAIYDLPDNCDQIWRVTFDNERIGATSQDYLYQVYERWQERSGLPALYATDELENQLILFPNPDVSSTTESSPSGNGLIVDTSAMTGGVGLIVDARDGGPLPGVAGLIVDILTGNGLEIFYYARPGDITADHINLPAWARYGILWFALAKAYAANTQIKDKNRTAFYSALYEHIKQRLRIRSAGRLNREWAMRGFAQPEVSSVLPRIPQHITES